MPVLPKRLVAAAAAAALTALTGLSASASTEPVAATESLFVSAGCPSDTPGTCTSTRWLGKEKGSATSNFLTATTPADEVLFRADGSVNWRDYASDGTLRTDGYPLRAADPVTLGLRLVANGVMASTTVHARITGTTTDRKPVTLAEQTKTVTVVADDVVVDFAWDLPDSLEGAVLKNLTLEVAVHGVNVEGGRIDQQGGSTVTIPYYAPAA